MEKYGVTTEKPDKTAHDEPCCPICGATLEKEEYTGQLKCPKHGTEPFEKQP